MMKVLIKRNVRPENLERLTDLLLDLRAAAVRQPGYVMGETLVRGENPVEVLAIGTWLSPEHWRAWSTSQQRLELEAMVTSLLIGDAEVLVYSIAHDAVSMED